MGFRSTFISQDLNRTIPAWFTHKWQEVNYGNSPNGINYFPISSKFERKFYSGKDEELFIDLQRVIVDQSMDELELILFHECGGVTKVLVTENSIKMFEPDKWHEVDGVTHSYCHGCSTPKVLSTVIEGEEA